MDVVEGESLDWAFVGARRPQIGYNDPHLGRSYMMNIVFGGKRRHLGR
jgi:hypothetical protein